MAVAEPTKAPAATVDAVVEANKPFATDVTASRPAPTPPAVATTATAHTATPTTQCHHALPLTSERRIGLLPQYE